MSQFVSPAPDAEEPKASVSPPSEASSSSSDEGSMPLALP